MKTRSKLMSRLLSLALCICMVLALLPAIPLVANAANATAGSKIYLKPNSNWKSGSAWFAAYFFNNSTGKNQWVSMSDSDGNGIYECSVPSGTWPNVIFCRMNPASTQTDWSYKWDQTSDLSFTSGKDLYTVTEGAWSNGSGSWSTATCDQVFHNMSGDKCTRCGVEGRTVYFQNNWEWQNVKVYYWKGHFNNSWPGESVDYHGEAVVDGITRYYSVMTVPADVEGFIINGTNNSNTGTNKQDQTATITMDDWYDGVTYCLDAYTTETDGHHVCQVKDFPICKDFAKEHKFVENVCTRCDVTWCQLNGHVDVDGADEAAAEGEDDCDVCGVALMDIFFKNNWNWSDVRLYYWYGDDTVVPANPGLAMEWYGKNHGYDYYRMKVPTGIKGFIVSGYRDDNSGVREQTVDITSGWYDGATFYPSERSGETTCAVGAFEICIDFPSNHRFENNSEFCKFCNYPSEVTIYFKNNRNWSGVSMYYWGSRIDPTELEFPGKSMELYENDGTYDYYYLTIPADCDGIKFSGIKPTRSGARDESADITSGWYEGITYSMVGNEGDQVETFMITDVFPCTYEHVEVALPAVAPTCVDTGLTEGVKCSRCGETLTAQQEVPATGNHADVSKVDGKCDVCGCLMQDVYLGYITASLEGNIAVNYFMLLSDAVLADETAYMEFTMADGEVIKVPISQSKLIDGYDVFTCEVAAKEMTDMIAGRFYYKGELVLEHEYNVRAYAKHIIQNSDDPNAKALMEAMVNYGAASQLHFGYNTGDLADNVRDKEDNLLITVPDYENIHITEYPFARGQGTAKVKLYSASLILNSETTLRLFFNGSITATHEGKDLKVRQRGGLYYVDIVNIAAKDLDDDVTITINDGTATADITFNPLSYCQIVEQEDTGAYTEEMRNLAIALYLYNKAAGAYFVDDGPQGIGLTTALHNLNGNSGSITGQVTSVTFGRSNQYRDIVGSYEGTLVDVEQDAPAYAYYVPNNSGYDVYVLSNDVIYAPTNSTKLFGNMNILTSVDTDNLDMSRVTNAYQMFIKCYALEEIDVSDWDTSKITDMTAIFYMCRSLTTIPGIENWDTSSCTNLYVAFFKMDALESLNLAGWDVSKVTNLDRAIYGNPKLNYLNITGWNIASACNASSAFASNPVLAKIDATGLKITGACNATNAFASNPVLPKIDATGWNITGITNATEMFYGCHSLTEVTGSGDWQLPNVTVLTGMFQDCVALESIDVSGWDMRQVNNTSYMFYHCESLTALNGIGQWQFENLRDVTAMFSRCTSLVELDIANWNMSKVEKFDSMFNFEHKSYPDMQLTTLDVSKWDTSSATSMSAMFQGCCNLIELDVSNWNVGNVKNFSYMFKGRANVDNSMKLTELNVSEWDTSSAENMECMFQGCNKITKLDVSKWNMTNVKCVSHMFADCKSLTTLDLSKWQTPSMVYMDAMLNNCDSLKSIDVSSFDTGNVKEFSQMFEYCYLLETIEGLEKWDTSNGLCFAEMFNGCRSLTELDLSSFDTSNANQYFNYHYAGVIDDYECFESMFNDMHALTKLTVGDGFNYDEAKVVKDNYKPQFPAPAAKTGFTAKWRNVDTGVLYSASEIPLGVAATYEVVYEEIPTT